MGRWVTCKGRRIYIPDGGEENPFDTRKRVEDQNEIARQKKLVEEKTRENKTISANEAKKEKELAANKAEAETASRKKVLSIVELPIIEV